MPAKITLRSLSRRISKSGRARGGLLVSILSSGGNLFLSIGIAHHSSISEMGAFAVAFAVYALSSGFVRAGVAEPVTSCVPLGKAAELGVSRASFFGLLLSGLVVLIGLLAHQPYLVVTGFSLHGLVIYEYLKNVNVAILAPRISVFQELSWFVCSVIAVSLLFASVISPFVAYGIWVGSGAIVGYLACFLQRFSMKPRLTIQVIPMRTSLGFGLDFIMGSGAAQISIMLLAGVAGKGIAGGLRAAGTIFGPVTLVLNTARSLLIPFLSRSTALSGMQGKKAGLLATLLLGAVSLPAVIGMCFLPDWAGRVLLGDNWAYAAPLIPYLACELWFTIIATVPFAGHRSLRAARRTLIIRSIVAPFRVISVVAAGYFLGAVGAAMAMASLSIVSSVIWWVSYSSLMKEIK